MVRSLKNVSVSDVTLPDFKGTIIKAGETIDGLQFGEDVLRASSSVLANVLSGVIAVGDGTLTYAPAAGVDLIMGTVDQLTRDGKKIITASDRPQNHYRHFTSRGDDLTNKVRGTGAVLQWTMTPEMDPEHIDIQFIDDVYLKDGHIKYLNADLGSYLTVETFVPPMVPFPAPGLNGNTDISATGVITSNTTNSGQYWRSPVETLVNRFINELPLLGSDYREALSPEPVLIPSPYITRFTVHNASDTNTLQLIMTLGLYRENTF